MANFNDFYGILSLNALKELANEVQELIEDKEQHGLMNGSTIMLPSINGESSRKETCEGTNKITVKVSTPWNWRQFGFRRTNATSV